MNFFLFHSLNMIIFNCSSMIFITANQIYEEFDKLKIFINLTMKKEVSEKLSGIGDGLRNLMHSINSMERKYCMGIK